MFKGCCPSSVPKSKENFGICENKKIKSFIILVLLQVIWIKKNISSVILFSTCGGVMLITSMIYRNMYTMQSSWS
jgi:hypothetical protein